MATQGASKKGYNNRTYVVKHILTPAKCRKLAAKYRLAVYSHCKEGPEVQSRAVKSILYHELDHKNTTPEQKEHYHRLCGDWCGFKKWRNDGNAAKDYLKTQSKDIEGNKVVWRAGALAGMDSLYPKAFEELEARFEVIGQRELMARCSRLRTSNINESIHAKLWLLCSKKKNHRMDRITFAAQQVMLSHNFGHLNASLLNCLGVMTVRCAHDLHLANKQSVCVAKRKYKLTETANTRQRRRKVKRTTGLGTNSGAYQSGGGD